MGNRDYGREYLERLGKTLRYFRQQKGFSQRQLVELGAEFGICSDKHYSRIENGNSDTTLTGLNAILLALGINWDELARQMYGVEYTKFQNVITEIWNLFFMGKDEAAAARFEELKLQDYYDKDKPVFAQGLLMCDSIVRGKANGYSEETLNALYNALEITCPSALHKTPKPSLNVDFVKEKVFSLNEYRILSAICEIKTDLTEINEAISILLAIHKSLKRHDVGIETRRSQLPIIYYRLTRAKLIEAVRAMDYEEVLFFCDEGIKFCKAEGAYKILGHLYCNSGSAYCELGNRKKAEEYFEMSCKTFSSHGDVETAECLKKLVAEEHNIKLE